MPQNCVKAKILILSCGTGEGHNSAAKALAENLLERGIACEVKDSVSFKSEKAQRTVSNLYNNLIRKAPSIFGIIYKLGTLYDNLRLPSPVYSYHARYAKKLYDYIRENGYNLVICTHTFSMQTMTEVRRKYAPDLPCYGVLTDYTAIPFYKETDLDGYFIANEKTREQLLKKGKEQEKIYCTGIPVDRKFSAEISKEAAREILALPQDKKIFMVMSGGAGCGKIAKLTDALDKATDKDFRIYVFTGKNKRLTSCLSKRFGNNGKFRIVGFTNEINLYMKAADIVFSKPGGLSSTEIAVANIPYIQLKAIPGCETQNKKYFTEHGLSLYASSIKAVIRKALSVINDESALIAMVEKQKQIIPPNSAELIINKIMELQIE